MTESNAFGRLGVITCTLLLVASAALAPAAVAQSASSGYTVQQGEQCINVTPLGDGSETVEEFYDYEFDDTVEYSSNGTRSLQRNQVSQLFLYRGTNGTSLVFLHDAAGDEPGGGLVMMDIWGLPAEGSWAVGDDIYDEPTRDDIWELDETSAHIEWMWVPNRTDGGAFRGVEYLDSDEAIVIDPAFNEEANMYGRWPYSNDSIEQWVVRSRGGDLTTLDMTDLVGVSKGTCGDEPEPLVGNSIPTDPDGDGLYEDVNGDGEVSFADAIDLAFVRPDNLSSRQTAAVDFDGDGDVDFDDAYELAFEI
ncbi:MAG: cell surface glycoprotein related protein [Halobacteriota archaeon]